MDGWMVGWMDISSGEPYSLLKVPVAHRINIPMTPGPRKGTQIL